MFLERNTEQSDACKESYKLLNIQDESVIIELLSDFTKFRTISIKSYHSHDSETSSDDEITLEISNSNSLSTSSLDSYSASSSLSHSDNHDIVENHDILENHSHASIISSDASIKRDRDRLRKYSIRINQTSSDICFIMNDSNLFSVENIETSQFIAFRQKKISKLLEKEIFKIVNSENVFVDTHIFNSRFVDEIKNVDIDKLFEKSRLIIQAYNDMNKELVLTQSSIIQRVSQRLIICLAASLQNIIKLYLRNVSQIYVQSTSNLNRNFYIRST